MRGPNGNHVDGITTQANGCRIAYTVRQDRQYVRRVARHVVMDNVPEARRIFRLLTVMENLRTGLDRAGVDEGRKQALLDKVYQYFPVLADRRNQAGGTLSGG